MSCPPEHVYSVYVDAELPLDQVREVESHLIGCRRCRQLILALEEESALLTDVLQQRPVEMRPRAPVRSRAHGLVIGLGPGLAIGFLIASVGGWLVEQRVPGFSFFNPTASSLSMMATESTVQCAASTTWAMVFMYGLWQSGFNPRAVAAVWASSPNLS